jgi:hypothetical protein
MFGSRSARFISSSFHSRLTRNFLDHTDARKPARAHTQDDARTTMKVFDHACAVAEGLVWVWKQKRREKRRQREREREEAEKGDDDDSSWSDTSTDTSTPVVYVPSASRFLNLPPEVRVLVYDLLEAVPDHSGDADRHRRRHYDGWAKTRKSLRLVCRQIENEWTPHFFRSTTFCMGTHYEEHTPRNFQELLAGFGRDKILDIRHLDLRVSRATGPTSPPEPEPDEADDKNVLRWFRRRRRRPPPEVWPPPRRYYYNDHRLWSRDDGDDVPLTCLFDRILGKYTRQTPLYLSTLNIVCLAGAVTVHDCRCWPDGPQRFLRAEYQTPAGLGLTPRMGAVAARWHHRERKYLEPAMGPAVRRERCPDLGLAALSPSADPEFRLCYRKDQGRLDRELAVARGHRRPTFTGPAGARSPPTSSSSSLWRLDGPGRAILQTVEDGRPDGRSPPNLSLSPAFYERELMASYAREKDAHPRGVLRVVNADPEDSTEEEDDKE